MGLKSHGLSREALRMYESSSSTRDPVAAEKEGFADVQNVQTTTCHLVLMQR